MKAGCGMAIITLNEVKEYARIDIDEIGRAHV